MRPKRIKDDGPKEATTPSTKVKDGEQKLQSAKETILEFVVVVISSLIFLVGAHRTKRSTKQWNGREFFILSSKERFVCVRAPITTTKHLPTLKHYKIKSNNIYALQMDNVFADTQPIFITHTELTCAHTFQKQQKIKNNKKKIHA